MNKIVKDAAVLTLITVISGLALGAVHDVTLEPIRAQEEKTKKEAYESVFADASGFEQMEMTDELSAKLQAAVEEAGCKADTIDEVMEAKDSSENLLGYGLTITSSEGYGGDIQFVMGIQTDGTVNGISILSIEETAGLGMNATTEAFRSQFAGKNVEAFAYTKNGASADNEINAISGATVTTNAMTNGTNAGLAAFRVLEGGN